MITRDSKASISGTAQNARQRFGEVLRHYRERRSLTTRRVADMIGTSREAVENYEAGHTVPEGKAWDKYKGIVHRQLGDYSELRNRALAEANAERLTIIEAMANRKHKEQEMAVTNGTNGLKQNLGDKLVAAIEGPPPNTKPPEAPASTPAQTAAPRNYSRWGEGRPTPFGQRPEGWRSPREVAKRRAFALDVLRGRPNIRNSGADSLDELLVKTFGCSMSSDVVAELRAQVKAEIAARAGVSTPAPVAPEPKILDVPTLQQLDDTSVQARIHAEAATAPTSDDDISTAVGLILDAIPGLQTFTISVDEHGEASVDYQIRKVKIETVGGSLKVKR